jgi:small-conductance mechanosensitive channel
MRRKLRDSDWREPPRSDVEALNAEDWLDTLCLQCMEAPAVDKIREHFARLSERVEQLQNKLNEDSQNFHILTLKAQVEQLERERDEWARHYVGARRRAEAEQERLREALREIESMRWYEVARRALAPPDAAPQEGR